MLFYGNYAEQAVKRLNAVSSKFGRRLTYNTDNIKCCNLVVREVWTGHMPTKRIKGTIYYVDGAKAHVEPVFVDLSQYGAYCDLEALSREEFESNNGGDR